MGCVKNYRILSRYIFLRARINSWLNFSQVSTARLRSLSKRYTFNEFYNFRYKSLSGGGEGAGRKRFYTTFIFLWYNYLATLFQVVVDDCTHNSHLFGAHTRRPEFGVILYDTDTGKCSAFTIHDF